MKTEAGLTRSERPSKFSPRSDCEKLGKPTENKTTISAVFKFMTVQTDWERKSLLSKEI